MKRKAYALSFMMFYLITAEVRADNPPSKLEDPAIQQVINHYLATAGKKEQVTGIAASVLIPSEKGSLRGKIVNYFAGTIGRPPYTAPVTQDNLFEIGSITKSFASAIILQLEAEGKLSINDKLGKWLPQYPNWKDITIKQLLNMTSDIPNYSANLEFYKIAEKANFKKQWSATELLKWASPDKPIKDPKHYFNYSNSNYILASLIIEKITNKSFAEVLKTRILTPFQLTNTFYPAGNDAEEIYKKLMPRMVHGYFYDKDKKEMIDTTGNNLTWASAAGAIIADTTDVIRWVQILYHGKLFDNNHRKNALTELMSVISTKTGQPIPTVSKDDPDGFGLGVVYVYDSKTENRYWSYKGSTLGYRVMYLFSPCNNITVAVALNNKAGEGETNSPMGDAIKSLTLDTYQAVIKAYPNYACKN
ncbi:serine hydrolase domain-containing protein [Legionella gresilensis]|uniref:serine hydrolase domain-containing protein n=1 Tax=Legionella gresilensis TaxID=91823 RepID=UPI001040E213|nr:serine hydrolase domain-containing protein [Legionella gresilensis]